LESVRGLAALTVLIFHSTGFLRQGQEDPLQKTWWELNSTGELLRRLVSLAFNGHIAVSLFFVLSGFVLALSLHRDDRSFGRQGWGFVGRRFFRIYPALAVNLLVTAAIVVGLAAVFPTIVHSSFTWGQLAENLLLYSFNVNGATWTLLIEILAIPLLLIGYLLASRFGIGGMLTLAAVTIVVLFIPDVVRRLVPGDSLFVFYVRIFVVDYQFMFVMGMLVAELPLRDRLRNQSRAVKYAMVAALVAMLSARFLLGYASRWSMLIEGAAAAALVGLLACGPRLAVHNLLEWHPIRFLGRISYSFYLYHATTLAVLVPVATWYVTASRLTAHPFLSSLIVAATATAFTIPLAWLSYNLVERPMMRLGRRF
jgi:peptidoglycan/LPS O-acetylase OafA/YrhL